MEKFFKKYSGILLFMFIYWIICFGMFFNTFNFLYVMLGWNILLAALPLFFIKKSERANRKNKKGQTLIWTILWLFFFPNSVYLVTDFIHISNDKFILISNTGKYSLNTGIMYNAKIVIWAKLLIIAAGFIFALLVGLESLYIFEKILKGRTSKLISNLGIIIIGFLSGIGVFIGRFLRFNSWDILVNPIKLIKRIIMSLDMFAIQFIIIFAIFLICIYILYTIFRNMVNN